ncbi:MAG: PQQ-dependent sugar dehydrogenase [Thermoleophilia bacterium]|nr:PQQ-dependent sugar dehydrogenase [Thermoleophilia bacterium]
MRLRRAAPLAAAALCAAVPAAAGITAPPGVRVQVVAAGIPEPTAIAFDAAGGMWVTSGGNLAKPGNGVWYVPRPGARPRQVVRKLFIALGLTWRHGVLYVSHVTPFDGSFAAVDRRRGRVTAFTGWNGRRFTASRAVLSGLPVGRHTMDNIVVGPDDRLYVGIGSRFDDRASPERLSAVVVSVDPDAARPVARVEARGLRNPYGLAFVPGTADLLVTDNGRDDLGLGRPPDEVNVVRTTGPAPHFGFPACWGQGGAPCRGRTAALVRTHAHASTDGIAVTRRFGALGLSAFVANNGSTLFDDPPTTSVQRVALRRTGGRYAARLLPFASGFRKYDPLGLAMGPNGALYLTLWLSGKVMRFTPAG